MTTKEILIAARAKIEKPENWFQGDIQCPPKFCAATAINFLDFATNLEMETAMDVFKRAAGIESSSPAAVSCWNDAPERTHADVLAAYDKAIAAAT